MWCAPCICCSPAAGCPPDGSWRVFHHVVGVLDQRAYRNQRRGHQDGPRLIQRGRVERSWWAADDPAPARRFAAQLGPIAKVTKAIGAPFRHN